MRRQSSWGSKSVGAPVHQLGVAPVVLASLSVQVQHPFGRRFAIGVVLALAGVSLAPRAAASVERPSSPAVGGGVSVLALVNVVELRRRIVDLEQRRLATRAAIAERAVALYIDPSPGFLEQLVTSAQPHDGARRQALSESVVPHEKALIDRLRVVELDLVELREAVENAERDNNVVGRSASEERLSSSVDRAVNLPESLRMRLELLDEESIGHDEAEGELLRTLDGLTPDARLGVLFSQELPIWPAEGDVSSEFGWRWGRAHKGIDITNEVGTPVVAARMGRVALVKNGDGFGLHVAIEHGRGISTLYSHLSAVSVVEGAEVRRGDVVGAIGCSGSCTGPHLHFEVRSGTEAVDPRLSLPLGRPLALGE